MKRIICALLLVLALALSLAACGKKQPTGDPSAQPPIEQPDGPDTPDTPAGLVGRDEEVRLQKERQRNALENQLKTAVDNENYEEAARLRDELKKLSA